MIASGYPVTLAVQDVTEDGHVDVVLGLASGLRILPGLGNGALGSSFDVALPSFSPGRPVVADLDGDHHPDLALGGIVPGYYTAAQMVVHGPFFPGMPTVEEHWPATNFASLTAGDVDGDGTADLVDAIATYGNGWIGTVETRLQRPDGTLGAPVLSGWPTSAMTDLQLADLDQDGRLDLLGLGDGGWYVGLGDGAGHFAIEGLEASGLGLTSFIPGPVDFDGDGRLDVVVNEYPGATAAGLEVCFGRDPVPVSRYRRCRGRRPHSCRRAASARACSPGTVAAADRRRPLPAPRARRGRRRSCRSPRDRGCHRR